MDLSDGLADAVRQVAEASGTGAKIDVTTLPVHPGAAEWFTSIGEEPVGRCLQGGDDYELLIAVPPRAAGRFRNAVKLSRGVPVTRIGELTRARDLTMVGGIEPRLPDGFVHF
jgi:thiamine-monophosphate kinase